MSTSCEISWFAPLCDDDFEFLGVPEPLLQSSFAHCRDVVLAAETAGFDNILLPSGYTLGIDSTAFAAAVAPMLRRLELLLAVRVGEMWPPQLARQAATINQILGGRLKLNIISSEMPGETLAGGPRYRRTVEAMHILRRLLRGERLQFSGDHYHLELEPPRLCAEAPSNPLFYFGGLSPEARTAAAEAADVYLMWPDRLEAVREIISDVRERARAYGRSLRFGYRVHVIVRETEREAREAAESLLSRLDAATGARIRGAALDSASAGVRRQGELRQAADADGYVEENLWTGIGQARSGAGAAIVGDPDQVLAKLDAYRALGIEAFILSGYPHQAAGDLFARYVLPKIAHAPLESTKPN